MNERRLTENLKLLRKLNAKTAFQLSYVDPADLVFCQTQKDEPNLKRDYQGKTYYYHDETGAIEEARQLFQGLSLNGSMVLYVYGLGLGYMYEAARDWLKENPERFLVFLEDDLAVVLRFLETELATEVLKDLQVKIYTSLNLLQDKDLFEDLSWTFVLLPFAVTALPLYESAKKELFVELRHQISYQLAFKASLIDEYLQYGLVFFRNFYPNLLHLSKASLGNAFFGKFTGVPAIICGAGPSLNSNINLLKDVKDKALIFAGGSALNAFCAKGVEPHFGAGIDPNLMQYERIKENQLFKTPFFYRNRLHHEALKALRGSRLYLTGSGGYDVAPWIEQELGIIGESLDEGHNIVNFSVSIAHALGCNPIIFVGVDMAYTNMESYAKGIIPKTELTEREIKETEDFDSQAILRSDIFGKPTYTLWKWISESEWISDFAKEHPDLTFINATEGGIGFEGIPNRPISEVLESELKEKFPLKERIQELAEQNKMSHVSRELTISILEQLRDSLQKVMAFFEIIMKEVERLGDQIKNGDESTKLETQAMTLAELDLTEEPGYRYLLDNFNMVYLKVSQRAIQSLTSGSKQLSESQVKLKKLELHHKRLSFLKNVAQVNIELINQSIA